MGWLDRPQELLVTAGTLRRLLFVLDLMENQCLNSTGWFMVGSVTKWTVQSMHFPFRPIHQVSGASDHNPYESNSNNLFH